MQCLKRSEEGIRSSGDGVTGGGNCDLELRTEPGSRARLPVLLTAESCALFLQTRFLTESVTHQFGFLAGH